MPEHLWTLTNTGLADLTVGTITISEASEHPQDFAVTSDAASGQVLPPGGEAVFGITFTPTATGVRRAVFRVPHDGPRSPLVRSVTGTGTAPPPTETGTASVTPAEWDAGTAGAGETRSQVFTITNTGGGVLTIGTVSLSADPELSITDDQASDEAVDPDGSRTVTVEFAPSGAVSVDAVLTIPSDDPASPLLVDLYGTGVAPPGPPVAPVLASVLWLTRLPAPAVTVGGSAWDHHPLSIAAGLLSPVRGGPAGAGTSAVDDYTAGLSTRVTRHISPPLAAQDLSGRAFRCFAQARRGAGTLTVQSRIVVKRWRASDGATVQLHQVNGLQADAAPWGTALQSRSFRQAAASYQYTLPAGLAPFVEGDRLVVELGGRVWGTAAAAGLVMVQGAAAGDTALAPFGSETALRAGWVQFCPGVLVIPGTF